MVRGGPVLQSMYVPNRGSGVVWWVRGRIWAKTPFKPLVYRGFTGGLAHPAAERVWEGGPGRSRSSVKPTSHYRIWVTRIHPDSLYEQYWPV